MIKKIPPEVSEFMRKIGRKGGRNGKGKKKIRKAAAHRNAAKNG